LNLRDFAPEVTSNGNFRPVLQRSHEVLKET